MLRSISMALTILLPQLAFAAAEPTKLRIRPARQIEIRCRQGTVETAIRGSSDELTILRVGETAVRYEIYSDEFIKASCESIIVVTP